MAEKYCVVVLKGGKEIGRSKPMDFDTAYKKTVAKNRNNPDLTWFADQCYVETAVSVKHLPIIEM